MIRRLGAVAALLLASAPAGPLPAQQGPRVATRFETFRLANGLRVVVHEDRSTPLVAVNVWYHVGSRNERPGRTGFAHLFEHLMFEGSQNVAEGEIDRLVLSAGGATPNGSTSPDRTNYFETVPSAALEQVLWIEADRMGWLLPSMTREKLDAQREVVKNERRESYENRPYGQAEPTILRNLYPPDHPYHWPTIGSMTDLDSASVEDVAAFFRTYYAPNNASLVIAGAVARDSVEKLVAKYFGEIAAGPPVPPVEPPPAALPATKYVVLEDRVQLPRLYMVWHSPPVYGEGDAALDVAANVLAGGKASRLYRKLVYERQVAQDVEASQVSQSLGSMFMIVTTARPGVALDSLERALRSELQRLGESGPEPRELQRAMNQIETSFVDELSSVEGKADRLNHYLFFTGDPGYAERDLARYRGLTPDAVRSAARRFLADAPSVVLSIVPMGKRQLAAREDP